jgi:hypothetical protein
VAGYPELVGPHVLVSENPALAAVGPDDGVELFHVAAMGVEPSDALLVQHATVQVDG